MTLVLDTSVVSCLMRREPFALHRLSALRPGELVLCAPVAAEISDGLERLPTSRRRTLLAAEYRRLGAQLRWSDWTQPAAVAFGRQKARLERAGTPVADMQVILGSVAATLRAGVTVHARDFLRLEGVQVDDWRA